MREGDPRCVPPSEMAGGEGGLEVVAPGIAIHIEDLAGKEQARNEPAPHRLRIHFAQADPAPGDERLVPPPERENGERVPQSAAPGEAQRQSAVGTPWQVRRPRPRGEAVDNDHGPSQPFGDAHLVEDADHGPLPMLLNARSQALRYGGEIAPARKKWDAQLIPGTDVAGEVEDRGAGEATMGEQDIPPRLSLTPSVANDGHCHARERDPSTTRERSKRVPLNDERGERGVGWDDPVPERRSKAIAVAGGPERRVRSAAGGEDDGPSAGHRLATVTSPDDEPSPLCLHRPGPDARSDLHPLAAGLPEKEVEHILRPAGSGEHAAISIFHHGNAPLSAVGREGRVRERVQGRPQEPPPGARTISPSVVVKEVRDLPPVRQVAVPPAGGEDLAARGGHPLEDDRPRPPLRRGHGREQARRPPSHDHHVPHHEPQCSVQGT